MIYIELGRKANGLVPLSDRDLAAMQATHKEQKAAGMMKDFANNFIVSNNVDIINSGSSL